MRVRLLERIIERLRALAHALPEPMRRVLRVPKHAILAFTAQRGPESAAGLSYYAVFSLFPLLLLLMAITGLVLQAETAHEQITSLIERLFPTSHELLLEALGQALALRASAGLLATIGLAWSASGFFNMLGREVNRAWAPAPPRSFLERRLLALGMVALLALLLLAWFVARTSLDLLRLLTMPGAEVLAPFGTIIRALLSRVTSWVLAFGLYFVLYKWVPRVPVRWLHAAISAAIAAAAWKGATFLFGWYVRSGLVEYQLVYGSLGSLVALLFWIYITSWITVLGAYLCAAMGQAVNTR